MINISTCAAVLVMSTDINDPTALTHSVSLSYLLTAYLIQCISLLLQAVLTFRQASPFQKELLAHAWRDNLVSFETCFPPSSHKLSVSPMCSFLSHVCLSLSWCQFLGSPFLSSRVSLYLCLFHILGIFASLFLYIGLTL